MTKEKQERLKEHARLLYTRDNITTQKELAERVGVAEKTIARWIEEEGWKKLKRNFILTREEQLANLLDELTELNEKIKTKNQGQRFADSKEANVRRYLIRDIKDLETETSSSEFINAFTVFINFVKKEDLESARLIGSFADKFIKTKLR